MFNIIIALIVLLLVRIFYSASRSEISRSLIYDFIQFLIDKEKYNGHIDYYEEMQIDFSKYLISIWLWGNYSMIKPEYRKQLIEFNNKKINKTRDEKQLHIQEIKDDLDNIK